MSYASASNHPAECTRFAKRDGCPSRKANRASRSRVSRGERARLAALRPVIGGQELRGRPVKDGLVPGEGGVHPLCRWLWLGRQAASRS